MSRLMQGLGWLLFRPLEVPDIWFWFFSALWVGMFAFPLGYWTAFGARPGVALTLAIGVALVYFGAVPVASGITPTPASEWVTGLLAILGGRITGAYIRRLSMRTASASQGMSG